MDLQYKIKELLLSGKSIVLVSATESGKTYWVKSQLLPILNDCKVAYFKDGNTIYDESADIYIFDEAETLSDRKYLEQRHPEDMPYYSQDYIRQVGKWHSQYGKIKEPSLYVITRNHDEEIENLIQNFKHADWDGRIIKVVKFVR